LFQVRPTARGDHFLFGWVHFLLKKKVIKLIFYKKTETGSNRPVWLGFFSGLALFFSGLGLVWFF
jgi:hypothetical protein